MSAKRYRALIRRKRAQRRRRAVALARARQRRQQAIAAASRWRRASGRRSVVTAAAARPVCRPFMMVASSPAALVKNPYAMSMPEGWQRDSLSVNGESRFSVQSNDGRRIGVAAFTPINATGLAMISSAATRGAARSQIGGISFATLRRTVIDKMIGERGWVNNDMEREIGGRRVFVVLAQTGDQQMWMYYFTELNGQVHSLAVKTSADAASFAAAQSEQFLTSLSAATTQPAAVSAELFQR
ncbi:MAG: hypothetical protein WKF84_04950 [Pyrinomonadaceae bacterium]